MTQGMGVEAEAELRGTQPSEGLRLARRKTGPRDLTSQRRGDKGVFIGWGRGQGEKGR